MENPCPWCEAAEGLRAVPAVERVMSTRDVPCAGKCGKIVNENTAIYVYKPPSATSVSGSVLYCVDCYEALPTKPVKLTPIHKGRP